MTTPQKQQISKALRGAIGSIEVRTKRNIQDRLASFQQRVNGGVRPIMVMRAGFESDLRVCTCQFIPGDPKVNSAKCGAAALPGKSWCEEHYGRVYQTDGREEAVA